MGSQVVVILWSTTIDRAKKETSRYGPFREKEAGPGIIKKSRKQAPSVAEHYGILGMILIYHYNQSLNLKQFCFAIV